MKFKWIIEIIVIISFTSWLYAGSGQFCSLDKIKGLNIDEINSYQKAGVPFKIRITAQNNNLPLGDIFIEDKTQSIKPKFISEFSPGNWIGTVTITKAGLTAITASYCGTSTSSNSFIVIPSSPAKLIIYPKKEIRARPKSNVKITAKVMDIYGNPISKIKCKLKVLDIFGDSGILSTNMSITNNKGTIFATYTLPARFHQAKIEIKTLGSPTITSISGTITTQPSIKTILF
jgi:hypothetical protein